MNLQTSKYPFATTEWVLFFMKELNREKLTKAIDFLKQALEINEKTPNCVDFDMAGNWNQVEIRAYASKDIPSPDELLYVTIDLTGEYDDDYDKIEEAETVLNNLFKQII